MIAHQRNILRTLGIDIWVPKQGSHIQHTDYSTYRDMQHDLSIVPIQADALTIASPIPDIARDLRAPPRVVEQQTAMIKQSPVNDLTIVERQLPVVDAQPSKKQLPPRVTAGPAIEIAAFELQAYVLGPCVLILDSQEISVDQQHLWSNIQAAQLGEYYELKWPFALPEFQDGRGVTLYIQGFIDALAQDKKVISLGALPHIQNSDIILLASLAQMLEQPILKKRLWQFMQA